MKALELKAAFLAESSEGKLRTVSRLAHNLTVVARNVSQGHQNETEAAARLRSLNEVQHTVAAKLMNDLGGSTLGFPDEDFVEVLYGIARTWKCERQVLAAFEWSLAVEG